MLENYIREFKALAEFFKMSWDYEKTPQRPNSVAWEVRKTNYAVPRIRNRNLTSPGLSDKSSPNYSGTNSPCPTIDENRPVSAQSKITTKNFIRHDAIPQVVATNLENCNATTNEEKFEQMLKESNSFGDENRDVLLNQKPKSISLEDLNSSIEMSTLVMKSDAFSQTEGIEDDNLTLQEYLLKCKEMNEKQTPSESIKLEETHSAQQPKPLPLSQIIKPQEISQKSAPIAPKVPAPTSSATSKTSLKANYSLRNQTIVNTKNQKLAENLTKKASFNIPQSHVRQSRPQVRESIPSNENIKPIDRNNLGGRSKTMIELPKAKGHPRSNKAGELRKKKSIEDNTDSSTSTLKASTEILGSRGNIKNACGDNKKVSGGKKPENKVGNSGDGEWRTVKTKRRSSWLSNRFDQPSASASLPALALLSCEESDKEQSNQKEEIVEKKKEAISKPKSIKSVMEQKKEIKTKVGSMTKQSVQKSKSVLSTTITSTNNKKMANVKAKVNSNVPKRATPTEKSKPLANKQNQSNQQTQKITRQKSDITGLKIKSLHKEYLRNEKSTPMTKKKKETSNDQKVDMNLQTSQILISETIDELYSELGQKRAKFLNGGERGNLSSCDEIEERDLESDDDQKKLVEEQENLERQIRELENCDIDEIDTETDETDCEAILCELDDNESSNDTDSIKDPSFINENMTLEMRYAPILGEMSVHEREETLATLQTLLEREPGRAMKLHQKLSSPSRRRSVRETLKKYQAKHFKAQEKRSTIQKERSLKIQQLIQRVEQVKAAREQLTENRRLKMEERLQRATENRENFLKNKIRKAHDEEEKLKEIAFIKNLEMQNKMLDFIESCKEQEVRLSSMELER